MDLSSEMVRVHAHLCGDGFTCIYKTKRKDRKNIAMVGYCNKNQILLDKFRDDFRKIFNVNMKMRKNREVSISSIRIYKEIDQMFGSFKSREWKIPDSVKSASKNIKLEWIKSFFEDEAYHEKRYNRIKVKSMNFKGLESIKDMLLSLGIGSSLTGPNVDKSYYLTISKIDTIPEFNDFVKIPIRK